MTYLQNYQEDGANYQARAVLAYLQRLATIEDSWNSLTKEYEAVPTIGRWENCREQGYVVSLKSRNFEQQLNIAFFEHRNSDSICAVKWEQLTTNTPTIESARFGAAYKDKWDVSHTVEHGKPYEMAAWIAAQLAEFWILLANYTHHNE